MVFLLLCVPSPILWNRILDFTKWHTVLVDKVNENHTIMRHVWIIIVYFKNIFLNILFSINFITNAFYSSNHPIHNKLSSSCYETIFVIKQLKVKPRLSTCYYYSYCHVNIKIKLVNGYTFFGAKIK